ncbi:alpha/beta fold hydrolase [Terriglobus saanensis]|nr:alpha/beta hydrolase [Terriglobus saanensis]
MMNAKVLLILLALFLPVATTAQTPSQTSYLPSPATSGTFTHNGVRLYYEVYGAGEPLLLVHGNGGSIADFKAQITFFRARYKVIAMDSRDQGRSANSPGPINYEKMTSDLAALLDYLHTGPVNVLGWSDGAIEALELGMDHPEKVKKIAAMAANLDPDGAVPEIVAMVKQSIASAPTSVKESPEGKRELKVAQMLLDEPHISVASLEKITAPTLILASDHDLIRDEHTLTIYHHIPNGELVIFPNATHLVPYDDPATFNATVDRFFTTPFVKKDRIQDTMKSVQAMRSSQH